MGMKGMKKVRPNYQIYCLNKSGKEAPDFMSLNIQFLLKIETKLKLNLIDKDQNSMISANDKDDIETHYLQIESVMERFDMGTGVFRQMWAQFRNPDIKFERFYVTDFDNSLNGNPNVEGEGLSDYE